VPFSGLPVLHDGTAGNAHARNRYAGEKMNEDDLKPWREAAKRNLKGIGESGTFVSLLSAGALEDPLCMMQLGLAIMLDKPILVVGLDDVKIPGNLRKVAQRVTEIKDRDPARIGAAVKRFVEEFDPDGKERRHS
jgi:hypothetical protein